MKLIKTIEEQFDEVLSSFNYKYIKIDKIRLKDDKIKIELRYKLPSSFGGNDYDFQDSTNLKITTGNNLESLKSKLEYKLKSYNEIKSLIDKAYALSEEYINYMKSNLPTIKQDLEVKLDCDKLEVSAWGREYDIFHDKNGFSFFIHPKKSAPADGEVILINPSYMLSLFWDNYNNRSIQLDSIVKRIKYSSDPIIGLTEKVEDLTKLQSFMLGYKPCDELKEALKFYEKGNEIYLNIKNLLSSNKKKED